MRSPSQTAPTLTKRRFTVEEYRLMAQAGILREDDRVELIEGEIILVAAIGTRHAATVRRLAARLRALPDETVLVDVQNPIQLNDRTEPQPDVVLLNYRPDFYATAHPHPADILLLVEVADSSIQYDREIKLPLYAQAQIPEVWIVNLMDNCLECYRQPLAGSYQDQRVLGLREEIAPIAFPHFTIPLVSLLQS